MSFEARYEGDCTWGDRIEPGDAVEYDEDGQLQHTECAAKDATDAPDWGSVCRSCFLQHRGECA